MMNVYLPKLNKEGFGGGNTFVANYRKHTHHNLMESPDGADVMFVANPMWAERDDFKLFKDTNRKIILRLDNIPEDWNNRGTAISKLKDFIPLADVVVYQSDWAKEKYDEFCDCNNLKVNQSIVIRNGVDTDLFTPDGQKIDFRGEPTILFVKSGRNENKRYPEVMEMYRRYWYKNRKAKLILVGQFADDTRNYNFGFYNGEAYQYLGIMPYEQLAVIYRSCDILLFPAYADAAPNTVLEAMASGCVPLINAYGGGIEFIGKTMHRVGNIIDAIANPVESIDFAGFVNKDNMVKHVRDNYGIKNMSRVYDEIMLSDKQ